MSLINDALKRAQEAQRPNVPSGVASMRTIETRPRERPFFSRILVVVIFLLLAAAFAFIGLAMTGRLANKNLVAPQAAIARPAVAVVAAVAPSQPAAVAPPVVAAVPVAAVAVPPPARPPVVAVPTNTLLVLPDTLHVQGVAYDPVRPWAIVSGKMVYLGDTVKGVQVLAITRNSVTFGSQGKTNRLYVGQ